MGLPQVGGDESDTERRQQAALEKQIRDLEKLREQEEHGWQAKVAARDEDLESQKAALKELEAQLALEREAIGKERVDLAEEEQARKMATLEQQVTESARAHSHILSKQVQRTCQFWLLTFWLLTT